MLQLNIPFKLGDDYEIWEKNLECIPDRLKGYDSYLYLGDRFNKLLNYYTDKTELIFSWDVLKGIVVTLNLSSLSPLEVINTFSGLLGHFELIIENNYLIFKFNISQRELWCCLINKTLYIIIADRMIISSLSYSLL